MAELPDYEGKDYYESDQDEPEEKSGVEGIHPRVSKLLSING
jgi:hypothetical protein